MADPGFADSIWRDLTGRGMFGGSFQWRLILQPLAATILGARFGIRDARAGKRPFFVALARGEGGRAELLARAARDAVLPLFVAFVIDSILQHIILGRVRPLAAVIVGGLLVFLPFLIVRALSNRIWTHGHPGPRHVVKASR
jgi:hypothetical protein